LRLGIGRPPAGFRGDVADFVLSRFDAVERASAPDLIKRGLAMVEDVMKSGLGPAMNKHHTKPK
jgi:PTH1 family peptidyl-tRNA hydrolase